MHGYLERQVLLQRSALRWAGTQLRGKNGDHEPTARRLAELVREAETTLTRVEAVARDGDPRLARRAILSLASVEYTIHTLSARYLPGLNRESAEDRQLSRVLLSAARDCGLDWLEDITVRLDSEWASIPDIPEIPLIYAPALQPFTLVGIPILFHEIGHVFFQRNPHLLQAFRSEIKALHRAALPAAGPLSPTATDARARELRSAYDYWSEERLNEIFSDVFATYILGPSYYATCVDTAVRSGLDPFLIDADVHPPWAVRVKACRYVMELLSAHPPWEAKVERTWQDYLPGGGVRLAYSRACDDRLIVALTEAAVHSLDRTSPPVARYDANRPRGEGLGQTLIRELNEGVQRLIDEPDRFKTWEADSLQRLMRPA